MTLVTEMTLAPRAQVWEQSAFWYLAGLEDSGGLPHIARIRNRFEHGPTTPEGKQFIRDYVAACTEADSKLATEWPYLPDFYRSWRGVLSSAGSPQ